jgi:hypothetical protein
VLRSNAFLHVREQSVLKGKSLQTIINWDDATIVMRLLSRALVCAAKASIEIDYVNLGPLQKSIKIEADKKFDKKIEDAKTAAIAIMKAYGLTGKTLKTALLEIIEADASTTTPSLRTLQESKSQAAAGDGGSMTDSHLPASGDKGKKKAEAPAADDKGKKKAEAPAAEARTRKSGLPDMPGSVQKDTPPDSGPRTRRSSAPTSAQRRQAQNRPAQKSRTTPTPSSCPRRTRWAARRC